jgi:hypothetical protein|tara:strand:- start:2470 stop:2754 length:285 start_codon:yes stop_codon:yes gene_type:complete
MIELFAAQTANADSSSFEWPGGAKAATFVGYGTWDTSTLKLQMSPDGGTTWIDVTGVSLTADGHKDIPPLGSGVLVRANLASVDASTSVSARIF